MALGTLMLALSGASFAWTINNNYDSQSNGQDCGNFMQNEYQDTKVSGDVSSSGSKSCKLTGYQGNPGHGGAFNFPSDLKKNDEFWMRFRLYMPAGFDYNVYSSGEFLKFMGIDTMTQGGTVAALYILLSKENDGNSPYNTHLTDDNCVSYQDCKMFFGGQNDKPQRGVWQTYELYIKLSDVPADQGGTGRMRVWRNGKLIGDLTRRPTMNNASDIANLGRLFTYWNGGPIKTQSMYIDDLVATNETPAARDAAGNAYIGVGEFVALSPPLPPSFIQ